MLFFFSDLPRPLGSRSWGPYFNMDGLLVASRGADNVYDAYVQIFRNGFIEAADGYTLRLGKENERYIPGIAWEKRIVEVFPTYLRALGTLSLLPYAVSISLLNVRDYCMYVNPISWQGGGKVDCSHLLTSEIPLERTQDAPGRLRRPLFDQIWNGCGFGGSINYDANGDWVERTH